MMCIFVCCAGQSHLWWIIGQWNAICTVITRFLINKVSESSLIYITMVTYSPVVAVGLFMPVVLYKGSLSSLRLIFTWCVYSSNKSGLSYFPSKTFISSGTVSFHFYPTVNCTSAHQHLRYSDTFFCHFAIHPWHHTATDAAVYKSDNSSFR